MKFFSFVRGKIKNMKKGTKIGWLLVALSIVLSVWVIIAQSSRADADDFEVSGNSIVGYHGEGTNERIVTGMPDGATSIDVTAFAGNPNIESVTISSGITSLAPACFAGCESLSSVTGGSFTEIPDQCFYNCSSLGSYRVPDTVTRIGHQAFHGSGVSKIILGPNVSVIEPDAFSDAYSLTAFEGSGSFFTVKNGCLYDQGGSRLIRVPVAATSVTIPSGVITIGEGAFSDCYALSSVEIPDSVSSIKEQGNLAGVTFYGNPNNEEIQRYVNSHGADGVQFQPSDTPNPGPDNPDPGPDPGPDTSSGSSSAAPSSSDQQPASSDPSGQGSGGQGGNNQGQGGTTPGGNAGGNTGGNTNQGGAADNGRNQGGTYYNGGGGGGTHTPDSTPKTADGDIDPRLVIAIAVFAAGLAFIIVGRRKKSVIVKQKREQRLDD